jgi:hypothetical protein
LADKCERVHEYVHRRLGVRRLWEQPASVVVAKRTVEGDAGAQTVWAVGVRHGGVTNAARGLWFGEVEEYLKRAVCYYALRDVAQTAAAAHQGDLRERPIPFWLPMGLAEIVEQEQRLELYENTAQAIGEKRSFLLGDLFEHDGRFDEQAQRAVFLQEAATVVEFLLGQKEGPTRLRGALEHLWERSGFTFSLRWEYRDLYPTLEAMGAAWEAYVRERPLHMLGEARLTLAQTEAALVELLRVEIPVIGAETIEQSVLETDFEGLSKHENRAVVQHICAEKSAALLQLALRSAPEFKPALEAYVRALNAIRDGKRRTFRRWYTRAQREHEAVRRLPYLTGDEGD